MRTSGDELCAEHLEGVQTELAEELPFGGDPVLVPVGEQVAALEERKSGQVGTAGGAGDEGGRDGLRLVVVDACRMGETKLRIRRIDDAGRDGTNPPKGRPQAGRGAGIARLLPERAGHKHPAERSIEEREEGNEPLRADGEMASPAVAREAEPAAEQLQAELLTILSGGHRVGR